MTHGDGAADAERRRLAEADDEVALWRRWGPYLSERQWGTVREDYSADGAASSYFTHDQARSRTYRWDEDGIAGVGDDKQRLCFAPPLWNGRDPIRSSRPPRPCSTPSAPTPGAAAAGSPSSRCANSEEPLS
ncbi:hypothetical protein [Streptomyces bobili]|uniref:hypothetical protein n=1 Tax=Streptomyces bobili TaxID=67280 RepID=UPI003F541463